MNKPRILFIMHMPPPIHGASMVGEYIKQNKIINQTFKCRYINLSTSHTIDEIGKNPFKKVFRFFFMFLRLMKNLVIFKPHLVYFSLSTKSFGFYKDAFLVIVSKMFGKKVVYHLHNKGVATRQHKTFDNFLYKKAFKNAEVILLSPHLYPDIQKYVPENKVHYCPNGIPDLNNNQKAKNKKQTERTEILFLSNLIESKGVFVLLEACKILQQKGFSFHSTFVGGEGDLTTQQFQEKVKELGLEEHVVYVGKKFGNEKAEIFSNADIFVHPTFEDCFPLVLLEAMQYALPTVSTFEGGIPDIIEEDKTGFLIPQKDEKALAEKLELLISNPELRNKLGKAGREKYENEFTINLFEQRLKDILSEIINTNSNY